MARAQKSTEFRVVAGTPVPFIESVAMPQIETILVPTDFSETAQHALQVARSLGRDHGSKLVLMTSPPAPPAAMAEVYLPTAELNGLMEEARREVAALAKTIPELPVETQVIVGPPGVSIVTAAEKCRADLIVMGTHGRSGLGRVLMGSVAEYVLRHAPCPVLTIKPATAVHLSHIEETSLAASESK